MARNPKVIEMEKKDDQIRDLSFDVQQARDNHSSALDKIHSARLALVKVRTEVMSEIAVLTNFLRANDRVVLEPREDRGAKYDFVAALRQYEFNAQDCGDRPVLKLSVAQALEVLGVREPLKLSGTKTGRQSDACRSGIHGQCTHGGVSVGLHRIRCTCECHGAAVATDLLEALVLLKRVHETSFVIDGDDAEVLEDVSSFLIKTKQSPDPGVNPDCPQCMAREEKT